MDLLKDMNIDAVAKAIEEDAGQKIPGLKEALAKAKAGKYGRVHTPEEILVRSTRRKLGLSQEEFAKRIGTPLSTLRGWEQGRLAPPESMSAAFTILAKKVSREKRIPFEVSVDPFYSSANMRYLEKIASDIKESKAHFQEHDLIEVE